MGLINDILLGFTLLACILKYNTQVAARIYCFDGSGEKLEDIKRIRHCNHGEICYFKYFKDDRDPIFKFGAGCRPKKDCKIGECAEKFYKDQSPENETLLLTRKKKDLVLCDECCYTGLCNKQGCGIVLSPVRRKCFGICTDVKNMTSCLNLTVCQADQFMCATQIDVKELKYKLGCFDRKACTELMKYPDSLDKCCDSDLCNIIPNFENMFNGTETDDVDCPRDLNNVVAGA